MFEWILIVIIVFLVVIIFIRDKGVRNGFKKMFSWISERVRRVRVKSKINKEKQKRIELITKLGEVVWEKDINVLSVLDIKDKIGDLKGKKNEISTEIEAIDKKIKQNKQSHEEFNNRQDSLIREVEEEKRPQVMEFNRMSKELGDMEKEIKEKEKMISKMEKNLTALTREIEEVEADIELSSIEKKNKREENENKIKKIHGEKSEAADLLNSIMKKRPDLEKAVGEIKEKVTECDERIGQLKDEQKSRAKESEEQTGNFLKKKGNLSAKGNELDRQIHSLFEKMGKEVNKKRIENDSLTLLYSQIDAIDQIIKDLKKQIE